MEEGCWRCRKAAAVRCPRCDAALYCGEACLRADEARHLLLCSKIYARSHNLRATDCVCDERATRDLPKGTTLTEEPVRAPAASRRFVANFFGAEAPAYLLLVHWALVEKPRWVDQLREGSDDAIEGTQLALKRLARSFKVDLATVRTLARKIQRNHVLLPSGPLIFPFLASLPESPISDANLALSDTGACVLRDTRKGERLMIGVLSL